MSDRRQTEELLRELHAARVAGELERLCAVFAADATFRIAGASEGAPISINASGLTEIRVWLSMLVKMFRLTRYEASPALIDGSRAAIQWRAEVQSRITGTMIPTGFIDLVEVRGDKISSYVEWFVPG